jgi:heterodisulfide reductase subunit A
VESHSNIELHLNTEVKNIDGFVGSFEATLAKNGQEQKEPCGVIMVATGAVPAVTHDFLAGQSSHVMTQSELEKSLQSGDLAVNGGNVVMIQCVGSRNEEHAYCSRICCSMAVKNALRIKRQSPETDVYVLYRDIRTYGFRETYYKQAREADVIFIRYLPEDPPEISGSDDMVVSLNSPDFPEPIVIEADSVVLSTGIEASKENRAMADMIKVPLNADGFFVEAHLKLRPVDFATEGIFLCGLAHSPKMADENISQAKAAAARAATVLSKQKLEVSAQVSSVDQEKCISCMTCIRACPFNAPYVNVNHKAEIVAAKCMGCGICASECPAHAIQLRHFESEHFNLMIQRLLETTETEKEPSLLSE